VEISDTTESLVEEADLLNSNTSVLSEQLERFGVLIKTLDVSNIFIDGVKSLLLRSTGEENGGISALDGVFLGWWLVIGGRVDLLNITDRESCEEAGVNLFCFLGLRSCREIGSGLYWLWSWFRYDLLDNFFNNLFNDFLLDSLGVNLFISGSSLCGLLATLLLFGEGSL